MEILLKTNKHMVCCLVEKQRVLDRNNLIEKNYKISLESKLFAKIVRNAAIHDNDN